MSEQSPVKIDAISSQMLEHPTNARAVGRLEGSLSVFSFFRQISAAAILRHCIEVEQTKSWRLMGYRSMADFLEKNQKPHGFSRSKYYELVPQMQYETDLVFEQFEQMNVSLRDRKVLRKNEAVIDYDPETGEIVIGGKSAPISDAKAVKQLVAAVRNEIEFRDHKIEKLTKESELKDQVIAGNLSDKKLKSIKFKGYENAAENVVSAYKTLRLSFDSLIRAGEGLPDHNKPDWYEEIWQLIGIKTNELRAAFRFERTFPEEIDTQDLKGKPDGEFIDALIERGGHAWEPDELVRATQWADKAREHEGAEPEVEDGYVDELLDRVFDESEDPEPERSAPLDGEEDANDAELVARMER